MENIIHLIEKDNMPKYLLFLEDIFPYMEKYHYQKGMKEIIRKLKKLLKGNNHGAASDQALLLDYQATMETKPEKAINLEKEALAQIKDITKGNAHLVAVRNNVNIYIRCIRRKLIHKCRFVKEVP